jgi:hypothetical protein
MSLRLRQIVLLAEQMDSVIEDFRAVLGLEECFHDPRAGRFGLKNSLLPLGNQFLEVCVPMQEGTAGGRYLQRRGGDGGYMVILQCDEHAPRVRRVEALGIRMVGRGENPGKYRSMQLHPKDTGGTFLEIDQQLGDRADDPDGPWDPAGGDGWQEHRRAEVVDGILAAEIQADDPPALARRWGAILDCPVDNVDGTPTITLDEGSIRFVPVTDGRGEGLAGLDLKVVDRDRLLSAARTRDCYRSDSQVLICGMRLTLV